MTTTVLGNNTGNTAGAFDAGISKGAPDSANGPFAGNYIEASTTATQRMLYKFTGLPSGTGPVLSAVLTFFDADGAAGATNVEVRGLLTAFAEADATWNNRQSGVPWNVAGVLGGSDVNPTVLATGTITTAGGNAAVNVSGAGFTALVEAWRNGTVTNNGIIMSLVSDTAGGYAYRLRTKESADGVRPYLTITCAASLPTLSIAGGTCTNLDGTANFNVALSPATSIGTDVTFTFNTGDASDTATAGVDFTARSSVAGTIPAGQTNVNISVTILP